MARQRREDELPTREPLQPLVVKGTRGFIRQYPELTHDVKQRAIGAAAAGATIKDICALLGIDRSQLQVAQRSDPAFAQEFQDARAAVDDEVEQSLLTNARSGDTGAIIFWLKNRRPKQWRERRDLVLEELYKEIRIYVNDAPVIGVTLDDIDEKADRIRQPSLTPTVDAEDEKDIVDTHLIPEKSSNV